MLETEFECAEGAVRVVDCMTPRTRLPDVIRVVEGTRGRVPMPMELIIRFDYGSVLPWVRRVDGVLTAIARPDAVCLHTPVETRGRDFTTVAEFTVTQGDRVPFVLTWFTSHVEPARAINPEHALRDTEKFWKKWASQCRYSGPWREALVRSLVTLKGLTYAPTGGLVAALTTSIP